MVSAPESREPFDINEAAAQLLLDIAYEHSIDTLAEKIVNNAQPPSDFIQIWLVDNGDRCPSCPFQVRCPDQRRCLHLTAAAGRSLTGRGSPAGFSAREARLPLGEGLIGQAAGTAQVQLFEDDIPSGWTELLGMNSWLETEQIRSMAAAPIVFKGEVLGVIAGFIRGDLSRISAVWARVLGEHIGAALANARAFAEIQRLKSQLEVQNTYLQEEVIEAKAFGNLIGKSAALRHIISHNPEPPWLAVIAAWCPAGDIQYFVNG